MLATGRHLSYGITQCYLLLDIQVNAFRLIPCRPQARFTNPKGWKAELSLLLLLLLLLDLVAGYIPR